MSIKSELDRLSGNIADAYSAVLEQGGELPAARTSANLAGAIRSIPVSRNPSLLDNGYFADPVNQKGQKKYAGSGYTIDRWHCQDTTGKLEITGSGVKFSDGFFQQFIERSDLLLGKTVTFSALTGNNELLVTTVAIPNKTSVGVLGQIAENDNISILLYSYGDNMSYMVAPVIHGSATGGELIAAKLELGPVQTLAHKEGGTWVLNDPPPNKVLEILKCQRYQVVFRNQALGIAAKDDNALVRVPIPLPVPIRDVPAISLNENSGSMFYRSNGIYNPVKSINRDIVNIDSTTIMLQLFFDGDVGDFGDVFIFEGAELIIDANL